MSLRSIRRFDDLGERIFNPKSDRLDTSGSFEGTTGAGS